MRLISNFSVLSTSKLSSNKKDNSAKSNPNFGNFTTLADDFTKVAGDDLVEVVGSNILNFIKNTSIIVLDFKAQPIRHLGLNWSNISYAPDPIAAKIQAQGGFKTEVVSEKLKEFFDRAEIMVYQSIKSVNKKLAKKGAAMTQDEKMLYGTFQDAINQFRQTFTAKERVGMILSYRNFCQEALNENQAVFSTRKPVKWATKK